MGINTIGATRLREFIPAKPQELLAQRIEGTEDERYRALQSSPPTFDDLLKFLVKELKPFIDGRFNTQADRAHTFVAGSGLGGLISTYAACEYPEVFGGLVSFSPDWTPLDGVFLEYLKHQLPDPATHRIYMEHVLSGQSKTIASYQKKVNKALKARGFKEE